MIQAVATYYRDSPCPANCGGFLMIRTTGPESDGLRTRRFECRKCKRACSCEVPSAAVVKRQRRKQSR